MITCALSIEPMTRRDLDAVSRIDHLCFRIPWAPAAFAIELGNRAATYLVARSGDEVVGYGGVWVISGEAHITTLAVSPERRRSGIGASILLALMEEALVRGARWAQLEVRESNRAARALYRKMGFREAAVLRAYYTDNGENAIVMWADNVRAIVEDARP